MIIKNITYNDHQKHYLKCSLKTLFTMIIKNITYNDH